MSALLERDVAPGLVARLARPGDQPRPPQLLAGRRVVRGDDAGVRSAARVAAPAGVHLAVGDDRTRGLVGRVHRVVEDLGVPHHLARLGVQGDEVVVHRGMEDQLAVDGDVAVGVDQAADHVVAQIVRPVAAILPDQVAGHRVDGLDGVLRVRHEHHAAADQRRPLLAALTRQGAAPDQPEAADVVAVDLVERAVAPAVERAAPHQPLVGARVQQLRVGDGPDAIRLLGAGRGRDRDHQGGENDAARDERREEPERRPAGCEHEALLRVRVLGDYATGRNHRASRLGTSPSAGRSTQVCWIRPSSNASPTKAWRVSRWPALSLPLRLRPARFSAPRLPRGPSSRTAGRPVPA